MSLFKVNPRRREEGRRKETWFNLEGPLPNLNPSFYKWENRPTPEVWELISCRDWTETQEA